MIKLDYRTDESWPMGKSAFAVGTSVEDLPTTPTGNPRIGVFPCTSGHADVHEVIGPVPLESLGGPSRKVYKERGGFGPLGYRAKG